MHKCGCNYINFQSFTHVTNFLYVDKINAEIAYILKFSRTRNERTISNVMFSYNANTSKN